MRLGSLWVWDIAKRIFRKAFFLATGRVFDIWSSRASVHARYGTAVKIGVGSVVDRDVAIGAYSYVNRDSTVEKCVIGRYCSISSGVRINPWNHNLNHVSTSPILGGSSEDLRETVEIEDDVLISVNVVVLSGVHLGTGSVVAAGAVVTKDVAPYEIVGGVPAKHIGWRFDESVRTCLIDSGGLKMPPQEALETLSEAFASH